MSSVLISGASIAGSTLAYWLASYGFTVTIVEKASAIRGGGYPIDVRGSAVDVVYRMGMRAELKRSQIHSKRITFLHSDGSEPPRVSRRLVGLQELP